MNKEFLKMQKIAGLITENQYKETLAEDKPIDPTAEDTVSHQTSGIKATLYDNGVIQICKDDKTIMAFKKEGQFAAQETFKKIKNYLENNPEEELDDRKLYTKSGAASSIGTTLWRKSFVSDKCGVEGLKSTTWAR
jgi:hypothetical protein